MKLQEMKLQEIGSLILQDWKNPYFGAMPYIHAMLTLRRVEDKYLFESGKSIVLYFLSNASSWKGETARAVKTELRRRIK